MIQFSKQFQPISSPRSAENWRVWLSAGLPGARASNAENSGLVIRRTAEDEFPKRYCYPNNVHRFVRLAARRMEEAGGPAVSKTLERAKQRIQCCRFAESPRNSFPGDSILQTAGEERSTADLLGESSGGLETRTRPKRAMPRIPGLIRRIAEEELPG